MTYKVVVATRSFGSTSDIPWDILREGQCEVVIVDVETSNEELMQALRDADGLIVGNRAINSELMQAAPRLKVISMHGVGVDHIDLVAASQQGISVTNCPGANANGVADLTLALMLVVSRPIISANRALRNGQWGKHPGVEIWQKTLGLIGLGKIGLGVARRALGFEMELLVYDPFVDQVTITELGATAVSLKDLLRQSDYVSLHTPLTEQTRGLITEERFKLMKPTAFLINTARGELINEDALYAALKAKTIAGAALDVFSEEPPTNFDLINLPEVIATPHIGTHSRESTTNVSILSAKNTVLTLQNNTPISKVV